MKVPEFALDLPFCVVYTHNNGTSVLTMKTPEEMHNEFELLDAKTPAYALNFGMIVRSQNV